MRHNGRAYRKRTYRNPGELLRDLWFAFRNGRRLKEITKRGLVSLAFRERLMLAVSAVNGCRYCSYFHARQALRSGVAPEEISRLVSGELGACPEEEAVAVVYAQHWAESDAHPDVDAVRRLEHAYGVEKAEAIGLILRMIRLGNLMGNTWDYLAYRISFGTCGR